MSEPYLAQIVMFGGNFAPRGWAFCDGQLLPINANQALFSLLGTIYGGDGRNNFALPDLRGRVPLHAGAGPGLTPRREGQIGGQESVALSVLEIPAHQHSLAGTVSFGSGDRSFVHTGGDSVATTATQGTGSGEAHDNMPPYLCVNFIIATRGLFPSRS